MKRIIFAMLALMILSSCAFSASSLDLRYDTENNGKIIVYSISDDDDSIAKVDLFITDPVTGVTQHKFTNVLAATDFGISIPDGGSGKFNFSDSDGAEQGLGTNITISAKPVQQPQVDNIDVVQAAIMIPKIDDAKKALYLDVLATLKPEYDPTSGSYSGYAPSAMQMGYNKDIANYALAKPMDKEASNQYSAELGPFSPSGFYLNSRAEPTMPAKDNTNWLNHPLGNRWYAYAICDENGTVLNLSPSEGETVSFAGLEPELVLSLDQNPSSPNYRDVAVQTIYDNDNTIENLTIIVIYKDGTSEEHDFSDVGVGRVFDNVVPLGDPNYENSFYNFADSDTPVVGALVFQNFIAAPGQPGPQPVDVFGNVTITPRISEKKDSFYVDIVAPLNNEYLLEVAKPVPDYELAGVNYEYGYAGVYTDLMPMVLNGTEYTLTLGPFTGELRLLSRIIAQETPASTRPINDVSLGTNRFTFLTSDTCVPCEDCILLEICYNEIDDDLDGEVDEGCEELADLIISKIDAPGEVIRGNPLEIEVGVYNEGAVSASGISYNFYMGSVKKDSGIIPSLDPSQAELYNYSYETADLLGSYELRAVVDEVNAIKENSETNNLLTKQVRVRLPYFVVDMEYNGAGFHGDNKQVQVMDYTGRIMGNLDVRFIKPSGREQDVKTSGAGISEIFLDETGEYTVEIEEEDYEAFTGNFEVEPIEIIVDNPIVDVGREQEVTVITKSGRAVTNTGLEVTAPSGQKLSMRVDELGRANLRVTEVGNYTLTALRNDFEVAETKFEGLGIIAVGFGRIARLLELLFGEVIVKQPIPLFVMLVLALAAAGLAYVKTERFFPKKAKSTRELSKEKVIRSFLGIAVFVVLGLVTKFTDPITGIAAGIVVVMGLFLYDFIMERFYGKEAIKV